MHWCSAGFQMPRRTCYDLSEPGLRPACLPGAPGRRQDHLRSACSDAPPSSQKTGDLLNLENFVFGLAHVDAQLCCSGSLPGPGHGLPACTWRCECTESSLGSWSTPPEYLSLG